MAAIMIRLCLPGGVLEDEPKTREESPGGGWPDRYLSKLLAPGRPRIMGVMSFDALLGGLGLQVLIIEDSEALAKVRDGLTPRTKVGRRCREPGNFAARVLVGRRPGSWIAEWMDRRVVRELSLLLVTLPPPNFAPPSSPFNSILERVVRCWHSNAYSSLFSSLFFRLPPNKFLQIPQDLS